MKIIRRLEKRIKLLSNIIKEEDISSYDPFDGLKSPYSNSFLLKNTNLFARILIKINNISPFNLRNFLRIAKTKDDPKVLADLIQSEIIKRECGITNTFSLLELKDKIVNKIITTNNTYGWGLQFPYYSRFVKSRESPNLFTTVNVTYALLKYYDSFKDKEVLDIIEKANSFIIDTLGIINIDNNGAYIRYYSDMDEAVYNVNALALRYLVEYQKITGDDSYNKLQNKICRFLVSKQRNDGSWFYSDGIRGKWIDGFHTGYVIEGLIWYYNLTKDYNVYKSIENASRYYKNYLIRNNFPLFKPNKLYPIDSQNCAQAIETRTNLYCIGLDNIESINDMYLKIENALLTKKNYYAFRKYGPFLNSLHYIRWSTSPFLLALCHLYEKQNN